jgi:hypothetical protein
MLLPTISSHFVFFPAAGYLTIVYGDLYCFYQILMYSSYPLTSYLFRIFQGGFNLNKLLKLLDLFKRTFHSESLVLQDNLCKLSVCCFPMLLLCCLLGTDNIPARGGRGLGGYDYYTLTYDDLEDGYEEDSLPGKLIPSID